MKINNNIKFGLIVFMLISFSNCDYLEYDETSFNRKDDVFNDFNRSKSYLTDIYGQLPTDFNSVGGAIRSAATDDAEHVYDLSSIHKFYDGSWSSIQPLDDVWSARYSAIRAVNLFLVESEGQTFEEDKYNDNYAEIMEQYNNFPFEARFLRAFFYFDLIKRYKNVPLVTTVLTPDEAKNVTQNSFQEVLDFIVSECDEIAPVLPLDYANFSSAKETGRATRGAALALKARALLYAASPLHNPTNNLALWEKAANAAKEVMDLSLYTLEANYSNTVNNFLSNELIFERREGASNGFERRNFPVGIEGGNTSTCPTQNLVDAYEMAATGLPITDPASGYNPNNPYFGRDPRLTRTILFNGSSFKDTSIETFTGGANALPIANATTTGYYLRKYVIEAINLLPNNTTTREHTWVHFRYAEILLNYAEAMNEAFGPDNPSTLGLSARQAVNLVRARTSTNMPAFPLGLSQADFRTKLRNERRVELAFEDHRFWDIRRWKIGAQTQSIYGMQITRDANLVFTYQPFLLEVRPYDERMNLYPIPQSEIFKSSNLVQNPGWE